jgi:hypothetical protein
MLVGECVLNILHHVTGHNHHVIVWQYEDGEYHKNEEDEDYNRCHHAQPQPPLTCRRTALSAVTAH